MAADGPERAIDYLRRIGCYRLSGYWFALRKRSDPLVLLDENGKKPKSVRVETLQATCACRRWMPWSASRSRFVWKYPTRFAYLKPELLYEDFAVNLNPDTCLTRQHQWCGKQAQLVALALGIRRTQQD